MRLELARDLLRSECPGEGEPGVVSAAVAAVLRHLYEALRPTLGGAGYEVLLGRATILAARRHPTLGRLTAPRDEPPPEEEVAAALPDGPDGWHAADDLVCEFLFYLGRLVGWPLALALLRDPWPEIAGRWDPHELERRFPPSEG